jgi:hypothetical protein
MKPDQTGTEVNQRTLASETTKTRPRIFKMTVGAPGRPSNVAASMAKVRDLVRLHHSNQSCFIKEDTI